MTVDASEKPAQYLWLGVGVVIGFGCATIAALYPGLASIWTAHGIDAVTRIAHHRDAWQVANSMFAVGIAFTVAGVVAVLTSRLVRVAAASTVATVALVLGTAGSTVSLANLAYRLTVTPRTAEAISHGEPVPAWYADITAWADDGLLSAAGLLLGASAFAYGIAVAVAEVARHWTGWFAGIVGLFLIAQFALTSDVLPAATTGLRNIRRFTASRKPCLESGADAVGEARQRWCERARRPSPYFVGISSLGLQITV